VEPTESPRAGGLGSGYRAPLPPRFTPPPPPRFSWQTVAVLVFIVDILICGLMWAHRVTSIGPVGCGLYMIPLLTLLSLPLFIRANRDATYDLGGLMATGLMLRFLASFYRFDHGQDGGVYTIKGAELARSFRHFQFGVDTGGSVPGTGGMRYIAGLVATVTASNAFAEFLVFSWLGFLGCYLLYRAFVTAMPNGDHRRYALLIFLWPTLLYWSSSVGKDCWMLFTLGIGAYGVARVLARQPGGYSLLIVGLLAGVWVRPHVSAMEFVAFAVALIVGRRDHVRTGSATPALVAKIAGIVLLVVIGALLSGRTQAYLDTKDSTTLAAQTAQGGSAFTAVNSQSPTGYPVAALTILFRPLPFESHGLPELATSAEALFLLALTLASWRRLITIPGRLRRDSYVLFALVYCLMFFFAFGALSNFGILARERIQLMPFVFVLLSVAPAPVKPRLGMPLRRSPA
jgi:hypothetical protein